MMLELGDLLRTGRTGLVRHFRLHQPRAKSKMLVDAWTMLISHY